MTVTTPTIQFFAECQEKGWDLTNEDLKYILNGDIDHVRSKYNDYPTVFTDLELKSKTMFLVECRDKGYDLDEDDIKLLLKGEYDTIRKTHTEIPEQETNQFLKDHDAE